MPIYTTIKLTEMTFNEVLWLCAGKLNVGCLIWFSSGMSEGPFY